MNIRQNGNARFRTAMLVTGIGFGSWLLAATPAGAVNDTQQVLIGGNTLSQGETRFTAPGNGATYTPDSPAAGKGESAAQIRMPAAGVLSALRVKLTTGAAPGGGSFVLMVRKNNADTTLTCSITTATGVCNAGTTVAFAAGDRLSVRVSNNFASSGPMGFTYALLLD